MSRIRVRKVDVQMYVRQTFDMKHLTNFHMCDPTQLNIVVGLTMQNVNLYYLFSKIHTMDKRNILQNGHIIGIRNGIELSHG